MSGPKISVYSLEREQQRLLGQIRKCDQQRTEIIIENSQLISDLSQMLQDICSENEKIQGLHHQDESSLIYTQLLSDMETALSKFISDATVIQASNKPNRNGKVILSSEELRKHEESLSYLKKLNKNAKKIDDQIRSRYSLLRKEGLDNFRKKISVNTRVEFTSAEDRKKIGLSELKKQLLEELEIKTSFGSYDKDLFLKLNDIRQSIRNAPDISSLKNFEKITLKSFYSQIESSVAHLQVLRKAYLQACDEAEITPNPIIPDCNDAVKIEKEIEEINEILIQRDARSYIIDTVDDVMREMGYDVIGNRDVIKRNGRKFHDELYSYSTGTAINIIYGSDGQITMELGGLSNNDNLPDATEAEILTDEMENFCESFSTIEKKLAERGILVGSRISLAPPSAEYAMTINLNDYQLRSRNIQTLQDVIEEQKNRNSRRGFEGQLAVE